jgi:hypothetical protein
MPPTLPDLPEAFAPDWLSDTVTRPHANVATSATRPQFEILPIDAVELDAVGLSAPVDHRAARNLWGASDRTRWRACSARSPSRPARRTVADRDAGAGGTGAARADGTEGELFLARLDMLLARGALDPALALMELAGPTDPQVFRRFFDVSLLTGHGDRACRAMDANPDIAPTFPGAHLLPRARRRLARGGAVLRHRARRWGGSSRWRPT